MSANFPREILQSIAPLQLEQPQGCVVLWHGFRTAISKSSIVNESKAELS